MESGIDLNALIEAIEHLSEKNAFDYVIAIVPSAVAVISTIIALIALCVSVKNANQQNRIALFEKRSNIFIEIEKLLKLNNNITIFRESFNEIDSIEDIRKAYLAVSLAVLAPESKLDDSTANRKILVVANQIANDLRMCEFLFEDKDKKTNESLSNMLEEFITFIFSITVGDIKHIICNRDNFNKACVEFEENHWKVLAEQIRIEKAKINTGNKKSSLRKKHCRRKRKN